MTSTNTGHGRTVRTMARSGIRRWRRAGYPIPTATGRMSVRGAGPGWIATRGALRRSTTAAGRNSAGAGAGSRVASRGRSMRRHWWHSLAWAPRWASASVRRLPAAGSAGSRSGRTRPTGPWYHASNRYLQQVNVGHVTNMTEINRNVTINNFVNRGAAVAVPANAMAASRPVRTVAQRVDPAQLAQARPVFGQEPVRPTLATAGVTPAVARQLRLTPTPGAVAAHPAAPGPAIRPVGVVPGAVTRPGVPPLHNPAGPTAALPATVHPLPAVVPPGTRPGGATPTGLPALHGPATPEARPGAANPTGLPALPAGGAGGAATRPGCPRCGSPAGRASRRPSSTGPRSERRRPGFVRRRMLHPAPWRDRCLKLSIP